MDIEFHYYMTYLAAVRAGYAPMEALVIAGSAQAVDDNNIAVRILDAQGNVYENAISQTLHPLDGHRDTLIYPVFHFIPGEPHAKAARRKDGLRHPMVTTPDSPLANRMFDAALASGDPYRIGVAAHGYADTWAHQNFVGRRHVFNVIEPPEKGRIGELHQRLLAVGHGHAGHLPDRPALVWRDPRLLDEEVDNRRRFLAAAAALFRKFMRARDAGASEDRIEAGAASLVADLDVDIGPRDDRNERAVLRRRNYMLRSLRPEYGGIALAPYVPGRWFDDAIAEQRFAVRRHLMQLCARADVGRLVGDWLATRSRQLVHWKNARPDIYRLTHWYRFQQAVKGQLRDCKVLLLEHQRDLRGT